MCKLLCEINVTNEDDTNINKFNNDLSSKKLFKQFDLITKYNISQKVLNYKLKWIKDNFDIKKLNKIELNGVMICDLMEILIEKFNIDDTPIIDSIIESIILSKVNEIAENIIKQFKNKLKCFIKENQNQSLNYYDLISFFFNFQREEGISALLKSKLASLISVPNVEIYIQKIIKLTFEEIEIYYKEQKNKYEELINNFGSKIHHKNDLKNIQEIQDYINNLSKYLKKYFIPIISYKMFNYNNLLNNKVNKYIINKLIFIKDNIKGIIESEKNKIIDENNIKNLEFENTIRDMKNKEREYLTALAIEREKYKNLENYLVTLEDENRKKINNSEIKLNELIKENSYLKNKKMITPENLSINGIKLDFAYVKNKLIEYKTNIDKVNNQLIINNQNNNKFGNEIKLLNIKYEEWTSKFEQLILNNFKNYEEKINNYKIDLDNANYEITKLKIELTKVQQNYLILETKIKDKTMKLEGLQSLIDDQTSLINKQEERINIQLKDIENYKKNKEDLEVVLSKNIVNYKLKEEEISVLLSVFFSVLTRNKKNYELTIKKLSSDVIQSMEKLNEQFIFFK